MGGWWTTTRTWVWWVLSIWALIGLVALAIMLFNLKWDYPDWRFVLVAIAVGRLAFAGIQTTIRDARNARRLSAAAKVVATTSSSEADRPDEPAQ